jgi:hypothetical protein
VRVLAFLRGAALELVSLLVDDVLTLVAAVVGLGGMYLLAHEVPTSRAAAGFGMYAVVWALLGLSLARAAGKR